MKFKKWLKPASLILLSLIIIIGSLVGCAAPSDFPDTSTGEPGSLPSVGKILDPPGNPFAHRFSDEADEFSELKDVPSSYSGEALKYVRVNAGETGLEFAVAGGGGTAPPRSVVLTIAASDATTAEKSQADILCSGTNDEADLVTADNAANGGIVVLSSGTFEIDASFTIDNCTLVGQGSGQWSQRALAGTELSYNGNYTMTVKEKGKVAQFRIETPSSYTGTGVLVWGDYPRGIRIVDDIYVYGIDNTSGTGFKFYVGADGDDERISFCQIGAITAENLLVGMKLHAELVSTGDAWINSNDWEYCCFPACGTGIEFDSDDGEEICNNHIWSAQLHDGTGVSHGIVMSGNCDRNIICAEFWEWSGNLGIELGSDTAYNKIYGTTPIGTDADGLISDSGDGNIIERNNNKTIYSHSGESAGAIMHGEITIDTAGEAVDWGELCYKKNDGKFWLADANAEASSKGILAICVEESNIAQDAVGMFLREGWIYHAGLYNWTLSTPIFISATTAGAMVQTAPSGTGDIIRIVGEPEDADTLWFDADDDFYEYGTTGITKINGVAIE